jgi:hypothetical protein
VPGSSSSFRSEVDAASSSFWFLSLVLGSLLASCEMWARVRA